MRAKLSSIASFLISLTIACAQENLRTLESRIREGDKRAIKQLSALPLQQAVNVYKRLLLNERVEPLLKEDIVDSLRENPGVVPFLANQIDEFVADRGAAHEIGTDYSLLAAIRTNESVLVIGKYANTRVRILYGAEDLGDEPLDGLSLAVIQQMRIPGAPYFHSISDSGFTDKEIEALRTWWNQNAHRFSANPRAIIPFEESVKHQEAQSQRRSQSIQTPESPAIAKPTATSALRNVSQQLRWFRSRALPAQKATGRL